METNHDKKVTVLKYLGLTNFDINSEMFSWSRRPAHRPTPQQSVHKATAHRLECPRWATRVLGQGTKEVPHHSFGVSLVVSQTSIQREVTVAIDFFGNTCSPYPGTQSPCNSRFQPLPPSIQRDERRDPASANCFFAQIFTKRQPRLGRGTSRAMAK